MKLVFVLSLLALAGATAGECDSKFDTDSTPDAYTPKEYVASWGVAEAAGRTTSEFPNVLELMSDMGGAFADPWVNELITQVALGVVFVQIFLMSWCYFSCCRYNCQRCNCQLPAAIKPFMGKIILAVAYGLVLIVGLTAFSGKGIIANSIPAMTDGMSDLGDVLGGFVKMSEAQVKVLEDLKLTGQSLVDGACDFEYIQPTGVDPAEQAVGDALADQMDTVNAQLREASKGVVTAMDGALEAAKGVETQLKEADDSITEAMDGVIVMLTGVWNDYLDPATLAFALIFVVIGICGMGSAAQPKLYKCTLCFFWLIAILVLILTAVLLLFSIVVGDLCVPKPTQNIANLMPSTEAPTEGDDGGGDFIQFFVACKGANPLGSVADEMLDSTTKMLVDSCNLLTDVKPAEISIEITAPEARTVTVSKKDANACNAAIGDPVTKIGLQGGMIKSQEVLKDIVKEIKSCKFVNEPLTAFLEDGFCNGFAGGFYSMYASLFSAIWFTILAMFITFPAWDVVDGTRDGQTGESQQVNPVDPPVPAVAEDVPADKAGKLPPI